MHVHYIGTLLAHAVTIGADAQVHGLAGDAGGDIEALGDVAVLGLVLRAAIGVGLGGGQWHALADLDQCGHAFAGLDLLDPAVTAFGAVGDDLAVGLLIVSLVSTVISKRLDGVSSCASMAAGRILSGSALTIS